MKWRAIRGKPRKHNPSGVLIVWLGNDGKIHTKSIRLDPHVPELVKINAMTELLLMTEGLTRKQAKEAYIAELIPSRQRVLR